MPPLTPIVRRLLIVNVVVFVAMYLFENFGGGGGISDFLALHYPASERFHPVQLVTHFFVHGSLSHIFFNMFGLVMFGPILESRYGPTRFIILYLVAAAGAVALHFGYTAYEIGRMEDVLAGFQQSPSLTTFNDFFRGENIDGLVMDNGDRVTAVVEKIENNFALRRNLEQTRVDAAVMMREFIDYEINIPMVGASGALYGVVVAFAILYPDFKLMLIFLPIPIKARYFVPAMLAIDLFLGIMQYSWDPIAHFAHLGGGLAGGALAYYWYKKDPPAGARRWN